MDISRDCNITKLNWQALTEIKSRIEKFDIAFERIQIELRFLSDTYVITSADQALQYIKAHTEPTKYTIGIFGKRNNQSINIRIARLTNIYHQEILKISVNNVEDTKELNLLMEFLGLETQKPLPPKAPIIKKTAFIAYRFNEIGETLALKLTRFLELLSFQVLTGRVYSPKKISEKVEERIKQQSIIFVILTEGDDDTWLIQEPVLAKAHDKPIFILKDSQYDYTSGIFSDQEFITFQPPNIENSFIQILEGLRELKLII